MNLTDAADIKINGKEVQQIKIDGNIVYTAGYRICITTDKTYILTGETATLTVKCEDLPFTQIELYNVIDMVQTKIADLTTDSNGQATYTYTGDGSGEIGFQAKCGSKKSNTLIIDDYVPVFSKVTSIWNTTSPVDGQTFIVTAYVRDQHDVIFEEETLVSMFIDGMLIDSKTSQDGIAEFSTVVHTGSHVLTLRAEDYVKNYNFTVVSGYDGMSLEKTAGSNILSYADEQQTPGSQTCTVTAQLKNGQSSATISSVPVVFGAYKDNVLITGSEQTVNTDANGQASYTYTSAGVGDVVIKAIPDSRSLLQETYSIQDCLYYNDGTKDDLTYQSGDFGSVVSEGLQLKGTTNSYQKAVTPTDLFSTSDNVSCEIKLGTYTSITPQLALYDSSYTSQGSVSGNTTYNEIASELSTSSRIVRNSAPAINEVWKITRENGQSKFYIDDVLLDTVTRSINNFRFGFYTYNNRTEVIKYIKIKAL